MLPYARILIVDDSRTTRRIVRGMLEGAGHPNIDEAADGHEALDLLRRRAYALVVSDWNMSPMSGLELLTAMRVDPRFAALPFVMATSRSSLHFSSVARDRGATRYIEKPFTAKELMDCIRSITATARVA